MRGQRVLLTSVDLHRRVDLTLPGRTVRFGDTRRRRVPDLFEVIRIVDGGRGERFKQGCSGIILDDGDCTLIATADAWDGPMTVVTDDLDLFDVCSEFAARFDTDALAHSSRSTSPSGCTTVGLSTSKMLRK